MLAHWLHGLGVAVFRFVRDVACCMLTHWLHGLGDPDIFCVRIGAKGGLVSTSRRHGSVFCFKANSYWWSVSVIRGFKTVNVGSAQRGPHRFICHTQPVESSQAGTNDTHLRIVLLHYSLAQSLPTKNPI